MILTNISKEPGSLRVLFSAAACPLPLPSSTTLLLNSYTAWDSPLAALERSFLLMQNLMQRRNYPEAVGERPQRGTIRSYLKVPQRKIKRNLVVQKAKQLVRLVRAQEDKTKEY